MLILQDARVLLEYLFSSFDRIKMGIFCSILNCISWDMLKIVFL